MNAGDVNPGPMRPIVVRQPVDPVEAVVEADARDAALAIETLLVRGPLFGVLAQDAEETTRWRVVVAVSAGCPQLARDSLNSHLWFRAKDEARTREERRPLLAAVARLERERVDELTVAGTRYRVVRAEEYTGTGRHGIEQPRPTDPEPAVPNWDLSARGPGLDEGLVLDPDAPVTPAQAAEQLALRGLTYTGRRFPQEVREDSERAVSTHPDVVLLPPAFRIVEKDGAGWRTGGSLHETAHDARRSLDFSLTWFEPRRRGLILFEAEREIDARTVLADSSPEAVPELADYVRAADRLRAERANEVEAQGTVRRICRARRLVRWGPDGPEGPRPSDVNTQPPERLHPDLDEDGVVHYESEGEDEEADEAPGEDVSEDASEGAGEDKAVSGGRGEDAREGS